MPCPAKWLSFIKVVNWCKKIKLKENDLKNIPGVGKNMEQHFFDIGIFTIDDLIGQNPEELFLKDCLVKGLQVDRCVLYVFRLFVYYANSDVYEPEKLKWWNWKEKKE